MATPKGVNIEKVREILRQIEDPGELRSLRALISGKLGGRRTIDPESQAKMQAGRRKKKHGEKK